MFCICGLTGANVILILVYTAFGYCVLGAVLRATLHDTQYTQHNLKHTLPQQCITHNNVSLLIISVSLFVCFLGVTIHCGCIFHSPVAGFSLLVFEVS